MRILLPGFVFLLVAFLAGAQTGTTSFLDRTVDIAATNEKITVVLNRVAQQGGFSFSYNSTIIPADQVVTLTARNKTVREVLNDIFKGSMNYKEKANHIILTRVAVKQPRSEASAMIISGYLEDALTKERIVDASVYEKKSITSVVTDEFGFFRIKLEKKPEVTLELSISKFNYYDTALLIADAGNQYLHISLQPIRRKDTIVIVADPVLPDASPAPTNTTSEEELVLPYKTAPNVRNINDTLYREFQASLVPFIGTNGSLSGNVINDYSFNLLGGYSLGTRQVEIGAFFNLDRGNVSWLQLAGFGNVVGGDVYGIQASGFFNLNGGKTSAVQATGFGNLNFKEFEGVQAAGFANINLRKANGVLVAGFLNLANGSSQGVQVAGFANVHIGNYDGPQVAGFANIATGRVRGSQVSPFFNLGGTVKGSQVGFINVADSLTGVPFGFLSFVNHGYHKIEVAADEVFPVNAAFRSGVRQFYNIIQAGFKPAYSFGRDNIWSFGYGIGAAPRLTKWLHLNFDITSQHVNKASFTNALSSLNKVHLGFDFHLLPKFSIYAGATLNTYLTNPSYTDYPNLFTEFTPNIFYEDNFRGDVNMKMWVGAKVGVRFL